MYLIILQIIVCNIISYVIYEYYINKPSNLPYEISGDDIYQKDPLNNGEYSRFNSITKESVHWLSRSICNEILHAKKLKCKVLVLGVALGDMIIHLSNKRPDFIITGIDISDINFDIVKQYSKTNILLLKEDANVYIENTNETYDYIICDLFDSLKIPDFVFSVKFLNKINNMLTSEGTFLINTVGIDQDVINTMYYELFPDSIIEIRSDNYNLLTIVTKLPSNAEFKKYDFLNIDIPQGGTPEVV